jgi:hypothetical protein
MAFAVLLILVTSVSLISGTLRLRRISRDVRREQPEWADAWKRSSWSTKRRIARALRRGETLHDPADARLLVGLARRADVYQRSETCRWRWQLPLVALVAVVGIATGNLAPAVQVSALLAFALILGAVLPRQRARRTDTVVCNQQLHGTL